MAFHAYSDAEIRKLGDRYLSKFEYDNVNGYAVRFADTEKNRFFSLTQYDTMASAKRAAVTYRNKLLRAGDVATAPEWKGRKGAADFVPLQMPGDKRLKHLIAALELLEQAGLEIVSQASLFLHVAMEADVTLPKLLDGPFLSRTSLKENLRKLSQDFPVSNGRSAHGLFERHGRGRRNPFVYELSDKGRSLVDALINSQPGRKRPVSVARRAATYRNDPRLAWVKGAIELALAASFITMPQLIGFLKAALFEGSSAAAITGKPSQNKTTDALRNVFKNLSRKHLARTGTPGLKLLRYPDSDAGDGLTKGVKLSAKGRRLIEKILAQCPLPK